MCLPHFGHFSVLVMVSLVIYSPIWVVFTSLTVRTHYLSLWTTAYRVVVFTLHPTQHQHQHLHHTPPYNIIGLASVCSFQPTNHTRLVLTYRTVCASHYTPYLMCTSATLSRALAPHTLHVPLDYQVTVATRRR